MEGALAHPSVIAAVTDRFQAGFQVPACRIVPVNTKPGDDRSLSAFVVLQFPFSSSAPATVGAPGGQWWMEEGAFRFVLSVPKGDGLGLGPEWAEQIAQLFRGEEFGDVVCFAPGSPVVDDGNETDAFFRLSFAVPYEFQFQQQEAQP